MCVLRFANILGPSADSPLAAYFSLPVLPTVLGYDPRLQFVHEDDVIEVLRIASHEPARGTLNSGTFNIAGDGVLLLSQCARRLGRPTVPLLLPAVSWVGSVLRTVGVTDFSPEQIRLLTHGRVVATDQMRETLGFEPKYTTAETFADFARSRGPGLLPPEALARAVDRLAALPAAGRWPPPDAERQLRSASTMADAKVIPFDDDRSRAGAVQRQPRRRSAAGSRRKSRSRGSPRGPALCRDGRSDRMMFL